MATVIAIVGGPRPDGNSSRLLSAFVDAVREAGALASIENIAALRIEPCRGCRDCEAADACVIEDNHGALAERVRGADILAVASPVYFCGFPGGLKNVIDRFQIDWLRRYRLGQSPRRGPRGYLIATGGAPSLKNFDGVAATFKYWMKAVWGEVGGQLFVPDLDRRGDLPPSAEEFEAARKMGLEAVAGVPATIIHPRQGVLP